MKKSPQCRGAYFDAFSVANFSVTPSVIGLMLDKKGCRAQSVMDDPQVYSNGVGEEGAVVVLACSDLVRRLLTRPTAL